MTITIMEHSPQDFPHEVIRIGMKYSCPQYTDEEFKARDWTGVKT